MNSGETFDQRRRAMICAHGEGSNGLGTLHLLATIIPLLLAWGLAIWGAGTTHWWISLGAVAVITLFLVRVFALMHECGHGSLFRSRRLNRWAGFTLGVISGMPQYVWSQHHAYHHRNNGNWEVYRGPLATLSVDEYATLTTAARRRYRWSRHIALAPLGGFVYLILNPRLNWLKGQYALLRHVLGGRPLAEFQTRHWKTWREYRHMTANNLVLLTLWALMCLLINPALFFAIYLSSLALAGGVGIMLFTVQHNFEQAYAANTCSWSREDGAMQGTSFLVLPHWMNWFTANIGYHHIHHISESIPGYRLVRCHEENQQLFSAVPRLKLSEVPAALQCLLWDRKSERIISFAQFDREAEAKSAA